MTHEFIISLKPIILQEWESRLKKSYCFEKHQFILLPIICPWKYGSFLEIICENIAKCPSFFPFFLRSSFSSFHSFSNSNVQDYLANLHTVPALLKAPCAVQLPFTNSQSPRFTTENILTQNPLTSRLLVKSTPRSI